MFPPKLPEKVLSVVIYKPIMILLTLCLACQKYHNIMLVEYIYLAKLKWSSYFG